MFRAKYSVGHGQQGGKLPAGAEGITCHPSPVRQVLPDSEGIWMLRARYALA
jgi:hypothetical protein